MKRFNGICIITQDVPRMSQFYSAALQAKAEGDEHFAVVATEGASLSFYTVEGTERMAPGSMQGFGHGSFSLEVQVEDVDVEYARMVAMEAPVIKPPTTQPWGWRSAWFRDPDGNILNFCAPVNVANTPIEAAGDQKIGEKAREYFQRLINEKDLSICDELLANHYIDHDAPADTPPGPGSIKTYVSGFLADYPDMLITIEDQVTEGNRVALRLVWHGCHRTTGEIHHKTGNVILHFNDQGQIVERWSAYKTLS